MKRTVVLIFFIVSVAVSAAGCAKTQVYTANFESYEIFGTYVSVKLFEINPGEQRKEEMHEALKGAEDLLRNIDSRLSASLPGSDIYQFNSAAPGERLNISQVTYLALTEAKKLFLATGGAYDPTVFMSVDLWGFSNRFYDGSVAAKPYDRSEGELPEQKYIEAFGSLTDFGDVEFGEEFITKPDKTVTVDGVEYSVALDLGGIGKGFAADCVRRLFEKRGEKYASINVGQSSVVFMDSPYKNGFTLEVRHPRSDTGRAVRFSGLENVSVGVSGDYQRYYEIGGRRYCHIIDTSTGTPVDSDVLSAIALCESGAAADGFSTVFMTVKARDALSLAQSARAKESGLKTFVVLTNVKNEFAAAGNADFEPADGSFKRADYVTGAEGEIYLEIKTNHAAWIIGGAVLLSAVSVVIFLDLRNRRLREPVKKPQNNGLSGKQTESKTSTLKRQKLFAVRDVFIYSALVVIIAILFALFVFGRPPVSLRYVKIFYDGRQIFSYDLKDGSSVVYDGFEDIVAVKKDGGNLNVSIRTQKGRNTVLIDREGKTRVVSSDCFGGQCQSALSVVSKAGDAVLCIPHALKIIGAGETDKDGGEVVLN